MMLNQWMKFNIPKGKDTLSMDAVEILIKMAWEEAIKSQQCRMEEDGWLPPPEIIGPYEVDLL